MINHYSEHAANERTLLAWLRTSLAVIGFGFLMEKFEYFIAQHDTASTAGQLLDKSDARIIGLSLVGVGILMMFSSILRYFQIRRNIEASEAYSYTKNSENLLIIVAIAAIILVMLYLGLQLAS